jgi:hypothetical protein
VRNRHNFPIKSGPRSHDGGTTPLLECSWHNETGSRSSGRLQEEEEETDMY